MGNIIEISRFEGQHLAHMHFIQQYGKVVGLFYGTEKITLVSDYDMLKRILIKDFHSFANRRVPFKFPLSYLDKALTVVRDQEWKNIRDTITPTFSATKLKAVLPIVDNSSRQMQALLRSQARQGQTVDIRTIFGQFSMEVILSAAFGVEMESQDSKLTTAASKLFSEATKRVLFAIISPYLLEMIRNSPFDFEAKYFHHLDRVARQVIRNRRQSDGAKPKDILQLMLDAQGSGKLSDDELVAQSFVFLLAGYETTATTLSFVSYLLALNPDVQDKLIDEIDQAFENDNDDDLSYDKINELKYLDMVISETLRLYPGTPVLIREASQDCTIGDYKFEKQSSVLVPVYAIHRDPTQWPEPDKFIPERFTPEQKQKRNPMSYLPFGSGPRNCIGMRFAIMEVKIALARVLRCVRIVQVKETEVPLQLVASITISAKNGVKLGLKER